MVRVRDNDLLLAIKITKRRIKFMEKHGKGSIAMEEKLILKKQERTLDKRRTETGRKIR